MFTDKRHWSSVEKIIKESWARYVQWYFLEFEYNELSRQLGRSELLTFIEKKTLPNWWLGGPGQPTFTVY